MIRMSSVVMKDQADRITRLTPFPPERDIVRNVNPALVERAWKARRQNIRRRNMKLPPVA